MTHLTSYNIAICLVVALGGFTYGFGFAVFVTSIGQPGFFAYFNLDPSSTYTANILGAVNSLFAFGAALGAIIQGWAADGLGRKNTIAISATCTLVGSALTAGSTAIAMLVTVRILMGMGLGMLICLVPLYITEVSPAHRRGIMTGLTGISLALGYTACGFISVGTYYAQNETLQWRLPLSLACFGPLAILISLPWVPETPRYLTWIGKHDKAWEVIKHLHHDPNDERDLAARAEYFQITKQVEFDKEQKSGYLQMFIRPSWRRRSILVMFLLFAAQSTGILGIANYMIFIFQSLGLEGAMPLILYGVYALVGTCFTFTCAFLTDRVGRRRMFLIGFPACGCCLLAEAFLQRAYLGTDNKGGNAACIVFVYLFIICYQCVDSPTFVWASEIFPTTIRAKGISLTFFAYFVGAITYTTPAALAFKNIKWGMYLLWAGLCVVSTVITYLYIPETTRMPIEEIGGLFGDEVVIHLTSNGHGILEGDIDQKMPQLVELERVPPQQSVPPSTGEERHISTHNDVSKTD